MTSAHIKEIYASQYAQLDLHFRDAWANKPEDPGQRKRLQAFGEVLALTQWNLRSLNLLPAAYTSALTLPDEAIDRILSSSENPEWGVAANGLKSAKPVKAKMLEAGPHQTVAPTPGIPIFGAAQLLLQASANGLVTIQVPFFDGQGEFVRYILTNSAGEQLAAGAIRQGRQVSFEAEAGKPYLLDVQSRRGSFALEVKGATLAYKSNRDQSRGFLLNTHLIGGASLPMYFYVPEGTQKIGISLGFSSGAVVDVYAPSGEKAGQLSTLETPSSRFTVSQKGIEPGLWKLDVRKPETTGAKTISLLLDDTLPQWFLPDATRPLVITETGAKK